MTTNLLDLLPRRYVNVSAGATYSDELSDPLYRTYSRLCGLAWQDQNYQRTHLPRLTLTELAVLCHRQTHALSLHLRQLRSLGFIEYTGDKHGYHIRICRPSAEQSFAPEQNFAAPMMMSGIDNSQLAAGTHQQHQQHDTPEQNFAVAEQNFAAAEQTFAAAEQTFAAAEQTFAANLAALAQCQVNPQVSDAQAVAALAHVTPEFIAAWFAELQTRPGIRNLPGLLLYMLRTTTQLPRVETRGGARTSDAVPTELAAPPALPEALLERLMALGFVGPLTEIAALYAADPEFVTAWVNYCRQHAPELRKPVGYLLHALRGESYPPEELPLPPLRPAPAEPEPAQRLWLQALHELALQMTSATFNSHLRGSQARGDVTTGALQIYVKSDYSAAWLANRLRPMIVKTLQRLTGVECTVTFFAETALAPEP